MEDNLAVVFNTTPSGRCLRIATRPAVVDKDVFIPLEDTVAKLKRILDDSSKAGNDITFIRAPVAAGKTTLANYLTTEHADEFVSIPFACTGMVNEWYSNIIEASGLDLPLHDARKALLAIGAQGKTIVIDEAHLVFVHKNVWTLLTKGLDGFRDAPRILLFSASGSAYDSNTGGTVATPIEIQNKLMWYPPPADSEKLAGELAEAARPIYLSTDSVQFFIKLCGGHRGIFMRAMIWVQECQENKPPTEVEAYDDDGSTKKRWEIQDCISHVRRTFEESRKETRFGKHKAWEVGLRKAFKQSRAVRVNGQFSDVGNIPKEFGKVLFGGAQSMKELNGQERELTVNGFVFPECRNTDEEFILYDWTDSSVFYGTSNPIMAEYYSDILPAEVNYKRTWKSGMKKPSGAADLLARVIPFMTFATVIDNPIPIGTDGQLQSPLSSEGLPYEDDYNNAITEILRTVLNYTVSTPKNPVTGKTDVVVTYDDDSKCAIESVMAWQAAKAHVEHAKRFLDVKKTNYAGAQHKALLIIGSKKEIVKRRVESVAESLKDKECSPEIIGLGVSLNHDSYEMYLPGNGPIFFVCDRVAKSLQRDEHGRIAAAQMCSYNDPEGAPDQKRPKSMEN